MNGRRFRARHLAAFACLHATILSACNDDAVNPPITTFTGNVVVAERSATSGVLDRVASLFISRALAQAGVIDVCVLRTGLCAGVAEDGFFVLETQFAGDVILSFGWPNFSARLPLLDVPPGATVTMSNITCSAQNGRCNAESVHIDIPGTLPTPS